MSDNGEFKLVTRRKKRARQVRTTCRFDPSVPNDSENDNDSNVNSETLFRMLLQAEDELKDSLFAENVFYRLRNSLTAMNVDRISDILCYGLGPFSRNRSSKYQLALLLSLKKRYGSAVYTYDPAFSSTEIELLKRLNFNIIETNEEGKRVIDDTVTLVYMPHCSIHLINNFLYANWCRRLSKCVLLTNSFSIVVDDAAGTNRSVPIDYIVRVQPYVTEIALTNNFLHKEAFNDLNIHVFLERDVAKIPPSFWNEREEPCYRDAETHYLTRAQTKKIDAKNSCRNDEGQQREIASLACTRNKTRDLER